VIQAINKFPDKDGSKRIFSKIDEGILEMMGRMAGLFLKSTLSNRKQSSYFHTLRQILKFGIYLNSVRTLPEVFSVAEMEMKGLLSSPGVIMYMLKPDQRTKVKKNPNNWISNQNFEETRFDPKWFRYTQDGEYIEYPATMGLISHTLDIRTSFKVKNCENHPEYNGKFSKLLNTENLTIS
jgi:hypothetical protein